MYTSPHGAEFLDVFLYLQLNKDVTPEKVTADTIAQAAEVFRSEECTLLEVNAEGTKIKRKQVPSRVNLGGMFWVLICEHLSDKSFFRMKFCRKN